MMDWKPMSEAIHDGREVIAVYHNPDISVTYGPWTVRWNGRKWISSWDGYEVVEYMGDFGTEYREPDMQPTHFMDMPKFP